MKINNRISLGVFAVLAIFFASNFINNEIVFATSLVNINTADAVELDTIPEVGPSTALKIIAYREANGLFLVIEDIMKVSGIKQATFDKMKDFITVSDDSGDVEDATCLDGIKNQDETDVDIGGLCGDGDIDDSMGTTTATTTATTTSTGGGSVTIYSTHYIQESISSYVEPTNIFEVSAGRARLSYINLPINFEAKHKVSTDLANSKCEYLWTFGDGSSLVGEKVEHIYKYVGDYNVVLNGTCRDLHSVSRTTVKVTKADLAITHRADGALEISNKGKYEINLYGWKVKSGTQAFDFPMDTIISAESQITFPFEHIQINNVGNDMGLVDTSGQVIAQVAVGFANVNNSPTLTIVEVDKFIVELAKIIDQSPKQVLAVANPAPASLLPSSALATSPVQNHSPIMANDFRPVNIPAPVPLTASVGSVFFGVSTTSEASTARADLAVPKDETIPGFWSKLFHPIRTIQDAFYQ